VNIGEKRISLGLKQAVGDPWEKAEKKYPVGSVVEGPISNLASFGAFVELGEGVEGMIHVGDITREGRIDHPKDILKTGQIVRAQVLEFDKDRRRIRLGLKQLEPANIDAWIAAHQLGEIVTGRLVDVRNDRAKVEVADGVYARCRIGEGKVPQERKEEGEMKGDLSQLTAMLAARWKVGADPQQEAVRPGQIRQFRITALDSQAERIEVELVG
jgi:small subunit ribosomal protein S1